MNKITSSVPTEVPPDVFNVVDKTELDELVGFMKDNYKALKDVHGGKVADYIPYLAKVPKDKFAISLCTVDGVVRSIGDFIDPVCLQSCCKPFCYCYARMLHGKQVVHSYVGKEPTGAKFNSSILKKSYEKAVPMRKRKKRHRDNEDDEGTEDDTHTDKRMQNLSGGETKVVQHAKKRFIPYNPMVNSGAIMMSHLIHTNDLLSNRFDKVRKMFERAGGLYTSVPGFITPSTSSIDGKRDAGCYMGCKKVLGFNNPVYLSECECADDNYSMVYKMRGAGAFGSKRPDRSKIEKTMSLYFQMCSIEITTEIGAVMAATLANGGICPTTGEVVFDPETVKDCLGIMFFCGMYDYSGEFGVEVGFPAKSGVSGLVMAIIPGKFAICVWSPPLDANGNSVRGVELCRRLNNCSGNYHMFRTPGKKHNDIEDVDHMFNKFMKSIVSGDMIFIRKYIKNVNVNMQDYDRRTFMHVACSNGKVEVIDLLLQYNALVTSTDIWNHTPVDDLKRYIMQNSSSAVIDRLRETLEKLEMLRGHPQMVKEASPSDVTSSK